MFAIDALAQGLSHNLNTTVSPFQALDGTPIRLGKLNETKIQLLTCIRYFFILPTVYPLVQTILRQNTDREYWMMLCQIIVAFALTLWIEYGTSPTSLTTPFSMERVIKEDHFHTMTLAAIALVSQPNTKGTGTPTFHLLRTRAQRTLPLESVPKAP